MPLIFSLDVEIVDENGEWLDRDLIMSQWFRPRADSSHSDGIADQIGNDLCQSALRVTVQTPDGPVQALARFSGFATQTINRRAKRVPFDQLSILEPVDADEVSHDPVDVF